MNGVKRMFGLTEFDNRRCFVSRFFLSHLKYDLKKADFFYFVFHSEFKSKTSMIPQSALQRPLILAAAMLDTSNLGLSV